MSEMPIAQALRMYLKQAESSSEAWHEFEEDYWLEATRVMDKNRKTIFNALKLQELVKEKIETIRYKWEIHNVLQSLVEESEKKELLTNRRDTCHG